MHYETRPNLLSVEAKDCGPREERGSGEEDSTPICLHARLTLVPHSHPALATMHSHPHWAEGRSPWGLAPRKALRLQPQPTATLPGAHSVPSSGGPFLVLQKYGLSGWLHHSCLQASKVLNCAARGTGSPGWTGPPALASCPGEPTVTERGQGVGGCWAKHCQGGRRGPSNQSPTRPPAQLHPKCQWPPATPPRRRCQPQPTCLCSPLQVLHSCLAEATLSLSRDQGLRL